MTRPFGPSGFLNLMCEEFDWFVKPNFDCICIPIPRSFSDGDVFISVKLAAQTSAARTD